MIAAYQESVKKLHITVHSIKTLNGAKMSDWIHINHGRMNGVAHAYGSAQPYFCIASWRLAKGNSPDCFQYCSPLIMLRWIENPILQTDVYNSILELSLTKSTASVVLRLTVEHINSFSYYINLLWHRLSRHVLVISLLSNFFALYKIPGWILLK
jgi:hypothetical protein